MQPPSSSPPQLPQGPQTAGMPVHERVCLPQMPQVSLWVAPASPQGDPVSGRTSGAASTGPSSLPSAAPSVDASSAASPGSTSAPESRGGGGGGAVSLPASTVRSGTDVSAPVPSVPPVASGLPPESELPVASPPLAVQAAPAPA